jgi:hypothetical protein
MYVLKNFYVNLNVLNKFLTIHIIGACGAIGSAPDF